jgi:hypothetical protein
MHQSWKHLIQGTVSTHNHNTGIGGSLFQQMQAVLYGFRHHHLEVIEMLKVGLALGFYLGKKLFSSSTSSVRVDQYQRVHV